MVFGCGVAFLAMALWYQVKIQPKASSPSSRILAMEQRLEAITKAKAEGKSAYNFSSNFSPSDFSGQDEATTNQKNK